MNLSTKQKQTKRHREQTCGCQGGWWWERDRLGAWDQQRQTIMYRMDNQQGPIVQHRELYSISCVNHNGKEYEKESLCCAAEIKTTL